ncbi:MAG: hypothetical protein HY686_08010 [Chloroflexi bacterium]|nr:hypothetical protein [Chloroflexota bacterium]
MGAAAPHPGVRRALTTQLKASLDSLNPSRRAVLTVSLDGTTLRLTASKGRRLLAWLSLPFNPQLVSDDLVNSPKDLAVVLRNAARRLNYVPSRVMAVYSGIRSVSRVLTIPAVRDVKPELILVREARRAIGVNPDQNYLFFRRVGKDQATESHFALSVPRQRLDSFVQTLLQAGLRPSVIDLKALALARAVQAPDAVIVNLEHTAMFILIVMDGVPQMVNNIPLDEAVALDEDEVRDRLLAELQRSLEFYQQRNPGTAAAATPLFLTGGHPALEGPALADAIQKDLNLSVRPLQPPLSYPSDFPLPTYLANVGLLLRSAH